MPVPIYPPVTNALFLNENVASSGDAKVGGVQLVRGAGRAVGLWSGGLAPSLSMAPGAFCPGSGHVMFFSGAGRMGNYQLHTQMQSGLPIIFYDAVAPTVGLSVSGQDVVGVIPPFNGSANVSGIISAGVGESRDCNVPFNSGLCAWAPSGCPGFTFSFTPEVSPSFPNP